MKTKRDKLQENLISIATLLLISTMVIGCCNYYKVQRSQSITSEELKTFQDKKKYIILHIADTAFHLTNIILEDNSFSGTPSPLPQVHLKYKTENGKFRYKGMRTSPDSSYINEKVILNEVHLFYTGNDLKKTGNHVTGYFGSIGNVDVYMKNKSKTTWSWLWPPLVSPVAIFSILIIFAAISGV